MAVKFYWARIGDGNYEPVAVKGAKGKRMAYTIGCPDPFPVDDLEPAIELYSEYEGEPPEVMEAPLTPKQEKRARQRETRYRAMAGSHGYAGFGR